MRGLSFSVGERLTCSRSHVSTSAHCFPFYLDLFSHGRPLRLQLRLLSGVLHLGLLDWLLLLSNWLPFLLPLVRLLPAALLWVLGLLAFLNPGDLGLPQGATQVSGVVLAPAVGATCFFLCRDKQCLVSWTLLHTRHLARRERSATRVVAPPLTLEALHWLQNERPDSKPPSRAQVNAFRDFSLKEHRNLFGLYFRPGLDPHGRADVVQFGQEAEPKLLGEATY